ncbi:hypothetical protein JTE90_003956 [Oedothorax gibbosus]|uniref:Uncharacterized protein n=1 Tax=Oedothorax gibbosus TaxID=931172 RepID=A0AAV6UW39_9ARAC|nr:hypothetical protein JTE90_003956 [Oedothorax gibbosus]
MQRPPRLLFLLDTSDSWFITNMLAVRGNTLTLPDNAISDRRYIITTVSIYERVTTPDILRNPNRTRPVCYGVAQETAAALWIERLFSKNPLRCQRELSNILFCLLPATPSESKRGAG